MELNDSGHVLHWLTMDSVTVPTPWLSAEQPVSPKVLISPVYGSFLMMAAAWLVAMFQHIQVTIVEARMMKALARTKRKALVMS